MSPSGADGPHSELLVTGHAELAHDEYVQRRVQRAGHFVCKRNSSAGERQHNEIVAIGVLGELFG